MGTQTDRKMTSENVLGKTRVEIFKGLLKQPDRENHQFRGYKKNSVHPLMCRVIACEHFKNDSCHLGDKCKYHHLIVSPEESKNIEQEARKMMKKLRSYPHEVQRKLLSHY